jgi:hypothetical protein
MIKALARWVLRDWVAHLQSENRYLYEQAASANIRWVELNQVMAHRAQQQRGEVCVRQGKKYLEILAVKTSPGGIWEINVK